MQTILIVEDEKILADLLADYLMQANYNTHVIANGSEVCDWVKHSRPALIVLDLMLPGKDGISLCKELRVFSDVPIIMATAKVDEIDRLLGLELGADDYVCKPYSPREVVARVRANLRRTSFNEDRVLKAQVEMAQSTDNIRLDKARYTAVRQDSVVVLTAVEFHLLELLLSEPGRIFTRSQLMNNMYADHRIVSDRTIDSHIKKIRKKLLLLCSDTELVHSVYGVGYRFEQLE